MRDIPAAELDSSLDHYREHGWAHLPAVGVEEMAALRARVDAIVAGDPLDLFFQPESPTGRYADLARTDGWTGPDTLYRKIERLEQDPLFHAWITNPVFARISDAILGPGARLYRAALFLKAPRVGSETPFHQDAGKLWGLTREPCLQLWTALDDAPPQAGCLEVASGSHRDGLVTPLGGVVPSTQTANAVATPIPARSGDVVLLHNLTWHRSGPNRTDRPRRGLTLSLLTADTRCRRTRKVPRVFPTLFSG